MWHASDLQLHACDLHVTCMWFIFTWHECVLHVTCMWFTGDDIAIVGLGPCPYCIKVSLAVKRIVLVSYCHVIYMWNACGLHVTCMWFTGDDISIMGLGPCPYCIKVCWEVKRIVLVSYCHVIYMWHACDIQLKNLKTNVTMKFDKTKFTTFPKLKSTS